MAQSVERPSTAADAHLAAMDWLDEHTEALAEYVGQWVAVADDGIVAHGEAFDEVVRDAERQGFDDPLLAPVTPYPFLGL